MSLFDACRNGDVEMVKLLMKDENDFKSPKFWLLIELACTHGHVEVIEHIYEKCRDVQVLFEPHFIAAVRKGHLRVVKFLAEKGIDIHTNNPLIWAASSGHLEVVKYLVEKGLDIHMPLKWASQFGHLEVVKFLVEKGADIHADHELSLRWASAEGHIEVVKFLLEKGAVIDYAIEFACFGCHLEVVKFLVEKGADVNVGLRNTRFTKHFEIAKFLVKKGGDRSLLSKKTIRYVSFCEKVENRRRIAAANKIGTWWIPICYDLNRECGKRMMERSWKRVEEMYAERN
jgi:ankyrin repeat protein